jgi:hypothetical protein
MVVEQQNTGVNNMRKIDRTKSEEIMNGIFSDFEKITEDWKKVKERNSIAAARRIRRTLDGIGNIKVELRKVMTAEEKE